MSSNNDSIQKTVIVALLLCLVCSIIVSGAAVGLKDLQRANKQLDLQKNILLAAGLITPDRTDKATILSEYEKIEPRVIDLETGNYTDTDPVTYDQRKASKDPARSRVLTGAEDIASIKRLENESKVFLVREDGKLAKVILPVRGYGLWSTLYGFVALKPDANTVVGLGFYEHAETPGLGGEVDNPNWKSQWPGKKVLDDRGELALEVVKGSVDAGMPGAENKVDGLSGATLTSKGVSNLVQFWLGDQGFGPYLEKLRKEGA